MMMIESPSSLVTPLLILLTIFIFLPQTIRNTMTEASSSRSKILNNKTWMLKDHPQGKFCATTDAELVEETIDLTNIPDHKIVVQVQSLSIDAFIRTMLDKSSNAVHGGGAKGMPIPALGFGKVIKGNDYFKEGAVVQGLFAAGKYVQIENPATAGLMTKMTLPRTTPSSSLGLLGISGIAAYIGMFVSPSKGPQKGETVVVSAAAGAVGCIAAQMAQLCGARVIGVAGGPKKQQYLLHELKLDGAVDYKCNEKTIGQQLDETCPNGIDFFFDNVGGEILDEVLQRINLHSRIVICGAASQYDSGNINNKKSIVGPSHYIKLAEKSSSMSGYNMMHYSGHFIKAALYLHYHYYRGNIVCPEHTEEGIESFASSLEKLFSGGHIGRLIVNV